MKIQYTNRQQIWIDSSLKIKSKWQKKGYKMLKFSNTEENVNTLIKLTKIENTCNTYF